MEKNEINNNIKLFKQLHNAIVTYNKKSTECLTKEMILGKVCPLAILEEITRAIKSVSESFFNQELWLPDLMLATDTMMLSFNIVENEIKKMKLKAKFFGIVVIGTVYGDVHDIGKTMVSTFLIANGFKVHDLGVNVDTESFLLAVKKHKPDILAMSSLLSTSMIEQKRVIDILKKEGLKDKVKVIVGGSAITEDFALEIGADGYDPTAPGAVKLAKELILKTT